MDPIFETKTLHHEAVPYRIDAGSDIFLRVKIGNRQVGATTTQLGPVITPHSTQKLETAPGVLIGRGDVLQFQTLTCVTNVLDVNPDDNVVEVEYELTGGADGALRFTLTPAPPETNGEVRLVVPVSFF